MKNKGLLLDRDGVINEERGFVGALTDFFFMPDLFPFLRHAKDCGYRLVIVTNQSGVARGYYTREDYDTLTIHMRKVMAQEGVEPDLVLACFTHPQGLERDLARESYWRKPKPGMVLEAAVRLDLDLSRSIMIGDKDTDSQAALAAGVGKVLLLGDGKPIDGAVKIKNFDDAVRYL